MHIYIHVFKNFLKQDIQEGKTHPDRKKKCIIYSKLRDKTSKQKQSKLTTFIMFRLLQMTDKHLWLPICIKNNAVCQCLICVIIISIQCNCYFAWLNFKR